MAEYVGIDLFSGAGGMSLGAKNAGIKVKLAVEFDQYAAQTFALNHPDVKVHADDIARLTEIPFSCTTDDVKILFGGPPCQGFSTSNQRTRNSQNQGNWLFREYLRIVGLWEPDWVIFENVKGITETEGGVFLQQTLNELSDLGYTCFHKVVNAADYSVPQKRFRLFVVATKHQVSYEFPDPVNSKPIKVKEVLFDLPPLSNGANIDVLPYIKSRNLSAITKKLRGNLKQSSGHLVTKNANYVIERYKHIKPGQNWESIPEELMRNYKDRTRCHTGIYYRLDPESPSVVIGNYRKNMLIHPSEDRGLSVREAARIQTFPDWYRFSGTIGFCQQQVGNAVPPILAEEIMKKIISCS